jgi:hypothetical protein
LDTRHLTIECPAWLLEGATEEQSQRIAHEAFFVRPYEQGLISSGRAGALLGMTRVEFLDLLRAYGVSYFDPHTDVEADARRAHSARS